MKDMKKKASIVFQMNFNDFESKDKTNRFFTLYKKLRKNRNLAQFCRDAFIEKAGRYLNGLDEQYLLLNELIKSKGIPYIMDAIKEQEKRSYAVDEVESEKDTDPNILVHVSAIENELQAAPPKKKPDMEKLKGLL